MRLEGASKVDLIRQFSSLSLDKIVKTGYPSIGSLKKVYGEEKAEKVTAMVLADLSHSFNNELSPEHIQEITAEISSSLMANISIEDVYLVCRKIKRSKNYGKLNVNKILLSLEEHFENRCEAVLQHNINMDAKNGYRQTFGQRQSSKELENISKNREAHSRYYTETIKKQQK
ncbi:MAG: hypothetical protein JXR60_06010 [Bacteroidales bacterium]|nr:hypothetical protein [Bacteroidales bacterium]